MILRKTTKFMNYHRFLLVSYNYDSKKNYKELWIIIDSVVFLYDSKKNYVHEYVTDSDCCCSFYDLKKVTKFRNFHRFLLFSFRKTTKFMNYHSFLLFSFMILEKLQSSEFTDFYCFVVILRKVNHEYVTDSDCYCPFYDPKKSYKVHELPQISVVF